MEEVLEGVQGCSRVLRMILITPSELREKRERRRKRRGRDYER
jgi:hypothetical protein